MYVFYKTGVQASSAFGLICTMLGLYVTIFGSLMYEMEKGEIDFEGRRLRSDGEPSPYLSILMAM